MNSSLSFYLSENDLENLQCLLLATHHQISLSLTLNPPDVPCFPVIESNGKFIFGSNNFTRYISEMKKLSYFDEIMDDILDLEEFQLKPSLNLLLEQRINWEGKIFFFFFMSLLVCSGSGVVMCSILENGIQDDDLLCFTTVFG